MARKRQVIETVFCDVCGRAADDVTTIRIGWDRDAWELDLCSRDLAKVERTFDALVAAGRPATKSNTRPKDRGASRPTPSERERRWAILESLGYERHPGRLSAEETEALERRRS